MFGFARKNNRHSLRQIHRQAAVTKLKAAAICDPLEQRLLFNAGGGWAAGGIVGSYYNNSSFSGSPTFSRTDVRIDFTPSSEAPGGGLATDPVYGAIQANSDFSVSWDGNLIAKYTETYTLKEMIETGDTGSVWFGTGAQGSNPLVLSGSGTQTAAVSVVAGQTYNLQMNYVHNGGAEWQAQLHWSSNGSGIFAEEAIEPATPIGANMPSPEAEDSAGFADGALGANYLATNAIYTPMFGNFIAGSTVVTNIALTQGSVNDGDWVQGYGIPTGTTITNVLGHTVYYDTYPTFIPTTVTLSEASTTTRYGEVEGDAAAPMDSDGQPTGDFFLQYVAGEDNTIAVQTQGIYTLSFTGAAELWFNGTSGLQFLLGTSNSTTPISIDGQDYYSYGTDLPKSDLIYSSATKTGYNATMNTTTVLVDMGDGDNIGFRYTDRTGYGAPGGPSTTTTSNGGITNLTIMAPTTAGGSTDFPIGTVFNPAFLSNFAPYSVLRSNDSAWAVDQLDANDYEDWSTRPQPTPWSFMANNYDGYTANVDAPPWEYDILLANAIGKDLYINIPGSASGQATDTGATLSSSYIYQLAELLKNGDTVDGVSYPGLLPNLNVYIEYDNEIWNDSGAGIGNVTADFAAARTAQSPDFEQFMSMTTSPQGAWVHFDEPVDLSGVDSVTGIYADQSTFSTTGGLDGNGDALSATEVGGVVGPAGSPDAVIPDGQTLTTAQGEYTDLFVDAVAVSTSESGVAFGVTYTDGSTASVQVQYVSPSGYTTTPVAVWTDPSSAPSQTLLALTPYTYYNTSSGGTIATSNEVYRYDLPINGSKTIASITLPSNSDLRIFSMTLQGDQPNSPGAVGAFDAQIWDLIRTRDISAIFRDVYGNAAMPSSTEGSPNADPRIRPLYEWSDYNESNSGQGGSADSLQTVDNYYSIDANYYLYGGGGGWYANDDDLANTTAAEILADAPSFLSGAGNITAETESNAAICQNFGLVDVGYEGGFDFGNGGGLQTGAQYSASTDPSVTTLVTQTLDQFFAGGGGLPIVYDALDDAFYHDEWAVVPGIYAGVTPKLQGYLDAQTSLAPVPPAGRSLIAGEWPLTDGSGTIATDTSINAVNGTLEGSASWTTAAAVGSSAVSMGSSGYIVASSTANLPTGSENHSISFWFSDSELSTLADGYYNLAGYGDSSAGQKFDLILEKSGTTFNFAPSNTTQDNSPQYALSNNTWYFLTMTYNGGTGMDTIYLNGQEIVTGSASPLNDLNQDGNVHIDTSGTYHTPGASYDDMRIYTEALSDAQVAFLAATPTLAPATVGDTSVSLNWAPVSGATSYDIFRSTSSGGADSSPYAAGVTTTSFTDTAVTGTTTYYYTVVPVDGTMIGSSSLQVSATTPIPPVGEWPMNAGTGSVATDSTSGGNNATLTGSATWTTGGPLGGAAIDMGSSGYVIAPSTSNLPTGTQDRSISVWFNTSQLTSAPDNYYYIAGYTDPSANQWFDIYVLKTGSSLTVFAGNTSVNGTIQLTRNAWNFLALTYDGSTNTDTLYVNGQQDTSGSAGATLNDLNENGDVYIDLPGTYHTPGVYQDMRIYSKALTAQEVAVLAGTTASAIGGTNAVTLDWTSLSGASSYDVFRSTTPGGEGATPFASDVTTSTFTDTEVTDGTTYYYTVIPVGDIGDGAPSPEVSATPS